MNARQELERLLAESVDSARHRADTAFDAVRDGRPVVLAGAGRLGRRLARAMASAGDPPIAFADADPSLHGQRVAGVRVMSAAEAVAAFPDAVFVIAIWGARSSHRIADTEGRLRSMGVGAIAPFTHAMWRYADSLPHYLVERPQAVLEQRDEVARALALFASPECRAEFVEQVRARLTGRVDHLGPPVPGAEYSAEGIVAWRSAERVVDAGAYDGDTLRAWLVRRGTFESWLAIEPHPANAAALRRSVATLPPDARARVHVLGAALGAAAGFATFSREGGAGAAVLGAGSTDGVRVPVVTLDSVPEAAGASFVKLDIEGDELDALRGMRNIVTRERPVLAVCAYHRQNHLWRVPLAIAAMRDGDVFHLRPHGAEGWDLVCYAVPRERSA